MIASLYLLMVMVMVGLNYRLKERREPIKIINQKKHPVNVIKTSSIRWNEESESFSSFQGSKATHERVFV